MSREYWFFLLGIITTLLLIGSYVAVKKSGIFAITPNQKMTYRVIDGHKLELHLFQAKGPAKPAGYPALLLFHGGAWQFGGPHAFYPQCRYFSQRGLTCISAQYRIASIHGTNPSAAVQDAQAAMIYLRQHAAELHIDPERIVAGGGSAGGHLAAALGVGISMQDASADTETPFRPNALVLYNPMLDLSPCKPDHHLVAAYWQDISPYHHVDDQTPPTLILLGTEDPEVPVSTAQAFCDAVIDKGGQCQLALYENAKHGFFNPGVANGKYFHITNQAIEDFLKNMGYIQDQ